MKDLLYQSIWLMLPAAISNMSPVIFRWLPFLNIPVDLNRKWRGKAILGKHKTYRGFFVGTIMAIVTIYIQKYYYEDMQVYSLLDYSNMNAVLVGFLLGFGALFGDSLKSSFKRRRDIEPGSPWPPFDQIDWIIGALAFVSFYQAIPLTVWIISIIVLGILHPIVNYFAYLFHIRVR